MNIGVELDDLANDFRDYVGVAYALFYGLEANCEESSLESHAAKAILVGLCDIEEKMRILAAREISADRQERASTPQPDTFRVWLKTYTHGETRWHLATEKQIDQIRELLDGDGGIVNSDSQEVSEEAEREAEAGGAHTFEDDEKKESD